MPTNPDDQMQWDHVRLFFDYAWKSFPSKLAIVIGVISFTTAILGFIFAPAIPLAYKYLTVVVIAILLVVLVVATFVRGLTGLLVKQRRLIAENQATWEDVRSLNAEKQALMTQADPHMALWTHGANIYGLAFYEQEVGGEVTADGGSTVRYHLQFAATHEGVDSVERFSWCTLGDQGSKFLLKAPTERTGSTILKPEIIKTTPTELLWKIISIPPLPIGKRYDYRYEEIFPPKSMAMTLEELRQRDQEWEFFSLRISYPTEKVKIGFVLPVDYQPEKVSFDVWYSERTRQRHERERFRILSGSKCWQSGWQRNRIVLALEVQNPIHGLTYVVKWIPPAVWSY